MRSESAESATRRPARSAVLSAGTHSARVSNAMPLPPILRSLVRSTPTVAPVPHRAIISVTGSQAAEFLNGLTAASVPGHPQSHFYSTFLHAQVRKHHLLK